MHIGQGDLFQHLVEIFCRLPLGHGKIVEKIVAAVFGGSTRHLTLIVGHKLESIPHQVYDIFGLQVSAHQQIIARQASHGSPIYDTVSPFGIVTKIGGRKVLDSVYCPLSEDGFAIGFFHADIEGGNHLAADTVFAGDIYTAQQAEMVDSEAGYCFHVILF